MMGKQGIGLDISADYISKAEQRPALTPGLFEGHGGTGKGERRLIEADARNLLQHVAPTSIDFVVTSPPYWDILLRNRSADYKEIRNYGNSDLDVGRISDYKEFLEALGEVFTNVLTVLKPGCYCCVVVMDLRKGSSFFPAACRLGCQNAGNRLLARRHHHLGQEARVQQPPPIRSSQCLPYQ